MSRQYLNRYCGALGAREQELAPTAGIHIAMGDTGAGYSAGLPLDWSSAACTQGRDLTAFLCDPGSWMPSLGDLESMGSSLTPYYHISIIIWQRSIVLDSSRCRPTAALRIAVKLGLPLLTTGGTPFLQDEWSRVVTCSQVSAFID